MKYLSVMIIMLLGMQLHSQQITLTYDAKGNRTGKNITGNIPVPVITGADSICVGDTVTWIATGGSQYVWSNGATTSSVALTAQQTTQFQLTAHAASGCTATIQRELLVRPTPSGYTMTGEPVVYVGSTTAYSTPSIPGVSYEWRLSRPLDVITSGNNTPRILVRWSMIPGMDSVMLVERDNNSLCAGKPIYKRVRIIPAVVFPPSAFTASIYPNPTTAGTSVRIDNPDLGPVSITVTNVLGQRLKVLSVSGSYNYLVPLAENIFISTGIYYIKIATSTEQKVLPLVVRR